MSNEFIDDVGAAEILGVSPGTLSVWRSTGRYNLPFVKIGRKVRYRRADLLAWLERRVVTQSCRVKSQDCKFAIDNDE